MPLINTAYRKNDSEDESDVVNESDNMTTTTNTDEEDKSNPKKRIATYTVYLPSKVVKVQENQPITNALENKSNIKQSNSHQNLERMKSTETNNPALSLLNFLPKPKIIDSNQNDKEISIAKSSKISEFETEKHDDLKNKEVEAEPKVQASIPIVSSRTRKVNLNPDVKLDPSLLADIGEPRAVSSDVQAVTSTQPAPAVVGPAKPDYLKSHKAEILQESHIHHYQSVNHPLNEPLPAQHFQSFEITDTQNVVTINQADLFDNITPSSQIIPSYGGRPKVDGLSKQARRKNQITYLAALAPETERKNAEKAKSKNVRN